MSLPHRPREPNNSNGPNEFSNAQRIESSASSTMLTTSSKISSLINNWNIRFDGNSSNFPIGKFIYVVSALTIDNLGGDFQLVCNHFHIILSGRAKQWFWRYRSRVPLCQAMGDYFSDPLSDEDVNEMIRERKQKVVEGFEDFYNSILQLCDRLKFPVPEHTLIEMLKRNLRSQLRKELFYLDIRPIAHLRNLIIRKESLMNDFERSTHVPSKKISALEMIETEVCNDHICSMKREKQITCCNCRK